MPMPTVPTIPEPPSRNNPANFNEKADAFFAVLPDAGAQMNALGSWMESTTSSAVSSANTARDQAVSARDGAVNANTSAQAAKTAAETARDAAQTAKTAAETARNAAQTARTGAETAQTGAQTALNNFNASWYGSRSTPPTGTIAEGALYFDTAAGGLRIRKNGAWVGAVASSFDEIWSLIKSSDGAGSGLDADTLDGKQLSTLVRKDDTVTQEVSGRFRASTDVSAFAQNETAESSLGLRNETQQIKASLVWMRTSNGAAFRIWNEDGSSYKNLFIKYDGTITWDGKAVTTDDKLNLSSIGGVELGNNLTGDRQTLIDFHSADGGADYEARIARNAGVNGNFDLVQTGTGRINLTGGAGVYRNGSMIPTIDDLIAQSAIGPQSVMCRSTTEVTYNATVAGSNLTVAGFTSAGAVSVGSATLTGTWRARGYCPANGVCNFVRVA